MQANSETKLIELKNTYGSLVIDGFEDLTPQQLFDMSLAHLRTTRKPSMDPVFGCTYGGSGCAAAPFLKPELRGQIDKCAGTGGINWATLTSTGLVPVKNSDLIAEFQRAHDVNHSIADPEEFMKRVEARFEKIACEASARLAYTPEVLVLEPGDRSST